MYIHARVTAIHYPDLVVTSPGGRCRLEARSPDNAGRDPGGNHQRVIWGGYQKNFVYAVSRVADGATLWRRELRGEMSPVAAWVHDDGWAVVVTLHVFFSHLLVLSPEGDRVARFDVCNDLLKGHERELNAGSAGPWWHAGGFAYFVELDGRPHWAILTLYGRRVVIDLATARRGDASSPAFDRHEREWALGRLREAADAVPLGRESMPRRALQGARTACRLAGELRLREAAPLLQAIEPCDLGGIGCGGPVLQDPNGGGVRLRMKAHALRQSAQLALRMLGVEPEGYAPYALRTAAEEGRPSTPIAAPERLPDRDRRAEAVTPGWETRAVIDHLGAPDHASYGRWEYELSLEAARTLRVEWSDDLTRVEEVTHVRPAVWTDPDTRCLRWSR